MLNKYLGEPQCSLIITGLIVLFEDNSDSLAFCLSPPASIRGQEVAEWGQKGKCSLLIEVWRATLVGKSMWAGEGWWLQWVSVSVDFRPLFSEHFGRKKSRNACDWQRHWNQRCIHMTQRVTPCVLQQGLRLCDWWRQVLHNSLWKTGFKGPVYLCQSQ